MATITTKLPKADAKCASCNKSFTLNTLQRQRMVEEGQSNFFCSKSCAYKRHHHTPRTLPKTDNRYAEELSKARTFIRTYIEKHSYSPSLREIMEALKHSSTSVTSYWLERFRSNGDLHFEDKTNRTYTLPGQRVIFDS